MEARGGGVSETADIALYSVRSTAAVLSAATISDVSNSTQYWFPGGTTAIPVLSKATITALVNYKLINPDGTLYPQSPQLMRGFQVAFEEVNKRADLLPNYFVRDQTVNYTGMGFNYLYSKREIERNPFKDALVYMTAPSAQSIIGLTSLFSELGLNRSIVACSLSSQLSNPKQFPLYLRPRVANKYVASVIARIINIFAWTHITVLYAQGDADYEDAHEAMQNVAATYGISIMNREDTRAIPATLNNSTVEIVDAALRAIIATHVRIIIILHNFPFVVMEQMYDLGIREEYVMLFIGAVNDSIFADPKYIKRRIVSKSGFLFIPRMFVGPTGAKVRAQLLARDGGKIVPNTCGYYDAAMLFFHATDFMLMKGLDYEDPFQLANAMRGTHFDGCSGMIKIEDGTNDRAASQIDLWQFQYNSERDNYTFELAASYNPFAATIFTIIKPLQWPDDQPTYTDQKPTYKECPYLSESIHESPSGHMIAYITCSIICLTTIVVTVLIWKKWWNVPCIPLTKPSQMSAEDVLVLASAVLDFFQLSSVGPETSHISALLASVNSSFGLKVENFISVTQGVYWIVLNLVFGIVAVWTTLCTLKFTGLDHSIGKVCGCLQWWSDLLMPTLGNVLFLPIVSTLLSVFLCYNASGPATTDAFLNKDCYQHCWTDTHLTYVVGSGVALALYVPLAVFTRPLWQETQRNAHIKAAPIGLMLKSVVQMVLVALSALLKTDSPQTHAYLFYAIVTGYIGFILKVRQYNYPRLNLWQGIVMTAMLLLAIVAFVTQSMESREVTMWVGGLLSVYAVMAAAGVVAQRKVRRFGSMLTRAKAMDLRNLFRFAFTFGERANEALRMHYAVNHSSVTKTTAQ